MNCASCSTYLSRSRISWPSSRSASNRPTRPPWPTSLQLIIHRPAGCSASLDEAGFHCKQMGIPEAPEDTTSNKVLLTPGKLCGECGKPHHDPQRWLHFARLVARWWYLRLSEDGRFVQLPCEGPHMQLTLISCNFGPHNLQLVGQQELVHWLWVFDRSAARRHSRRFSLSGNRLSLAPSNVVPDQRLVSLKHSITGFWDISRAYSLMSFLHQGTVAPEYCHVQ